MIGVAKGPDRRAGDERLFVAGRAHPLMPGPDSLALNLIQHIRDEAHRFAITGHRKRRQKARNTSILEQIPGLGPKRRHDLLKYFGGLRGVARASEEELAKVPGISRFLAGDIYHGLHGD
jgi:excinuclease ABC subunit C